MSKYFRRAYHWLTVYEMIQHGARKAECPHCGNDALLYYDGSHVSGFCPWCGKNIGTLVCAKCGKYRCNNREEAWYSGIKYGFDGPELWYCEKCLKRYHLEGTDQKTGKLVVG